MKIGEMAPWSSHSSRPASRLVRTPGKGGSSSGGGASGPEKAAVKRKGASSKPEPSAIHSSGGGVSGSAGVSGAGDSSGDEATLSRAAFESCWYQLAALNTSRVDANSYAVWIHEVVSRLTKEARVQEHAGTADVLPHGRPHVYQPQQGQQQAQQQRQRQRQAAPPTQRVWRSDNELIGELREACVKAGVAPSSAISQQASQLVPLAARPHPAERSAVSASAHPHYTAHRWTLGDARTLASSPTSSN